ncbi:hypothetical protein AV530_012678 [Patagioenas fasciata monilis]|uniref:Uncharacterized protein n=1 Tax=Patagioenas fasciata monilis TaxID=372326 RepID=A0A1V4JC63_PATFA|nr:hypothetical protein AV530_012678 [Patagioenas fasciata monilis]
MTVQLASLLLEGPSNNGMKKNEEIGVSILHCQSLELCCPSLALVSAGTAQPCSQLPDSPHYSPNNQWISNTSTLPSLHLFVPGRQQEELGHASAATAHGKNSFISITSRSTSQRKQQQ